MLKQLVDLWIINQQRSGIIYVINGAKMLRDWFQVVPTSEFAALLNFLSL